MKYFDQFFKKYDYPSVVYINLLYSLCQWRAWDEKSQVNVILLLLF